jgi:hypothetical protein
MPEPTQEGGVDKEQFGRVKSLVQQTERTIRAAHNIPDGEIPEAADHLWDQGDRSLQNYLRQPLNPGGANYDIQIPGEDGQPEFQMVVIHLEDGIMKRLADASPRSLLKDPALHKDYQTLIEEVSHFVYTYYYRHQHGEIPHSAAIELMAVLDEYNVLQSLTQQYEGRVLSTDEHLQAIQYQQAAYNEKMRGQRPPQYILGHELGLEYLDYLNKLHNAGEDAGIEIAQFYNAPNSTQFRHLIYDLGLEITTYGEQEDREVGQTLHELQVAAQKR